jgi:FKBP-type peptidyl-prolyl cis-trans isomerase SlyD
MSSEQKASKITVAYVIRLDDQTVVEQVDEQSPFEFVPGQSEVIPAFEEAVAGKPAGDELRFSVEPADGYGERNEELVQKIPTEAFEEGEDLEVGERYTAETVDGTPVAFLAREVGDGHVLADFNHPLAGQKLHFEVKVLAVE